MQKFLPVMNASPLLRSLIRFHFFSWRKSFLFSLYKIFLLKLLALCQVQDWLYMDGEDANATEFQERLDMLKAVGDPIFFRSVVFSVWFTFVDFVYFSVPYSMLKFL